MFCVVRRCEPLAGYTNIQSKSTGQRERECVKEKMKICIFKITLFKTIFRPFYSQNKHKRNIDTSMITKRTRTYMLHCTLGFRLLWRTHIPRYYPPPHPFLPVTQICRTCSTTPLKHARVSACTYAVKD